MTNIALNKKGFTLLEALLGIMMLTILLAFCLNFFTVIKDNKYDNGSKREMILFLGQIQEDLLEAKTISSDEEGFYLINFLDDTISYTKDDSKIVRKVNNTGYEVALNNVKNIELNIEQNLLKTKIVFNDDFVYEGVIGAVK